MNNRRWRILAALALAVSGSEAALGEGLYWESTTTGAGPAARTSKSYAMPKMFKIVEADGQVILLRSDQDRFISIDTEAKTYREMTFAELEKATEAAQAQMKDAMAKMQARMKSMPPEQRAMMEKMMPAMPGAAAPANVTLKNTGETKTIAGHSCTKFVATDGDKTLLVACATKDIAAFNELRSDWLALQKRMSSLNQAGGSGVADAFSKIDGFPLETEMGSVKTVVTKVESKSTPASEFEVPAGFKKLPMDLPKAPPN